MTVLRNAEQPNTEANEQPIKRLTGRKILLALLAVLGAVAASGVLCVCLLYRSTRLYVNAELGDPVPDASAFLRTGSTAEYLIEPEREYPIGNHVLEISVDGHPRLVLLRVRDTIPPAAEGAEQTISTKASPKPDKLLRHITDETVVKLTYEVMPKYGTVGDYTAIIRMEDQSGNDTRIPVRVHVRIARDSVVCEAGDPAPDAEAFLIDDYEVESFSEITEEMMCTPGVYPIRITADGISAESKLIVADTIAPEAFGRTVIVTPEDELEPEDFVSEATDVTELNFSYVNEPDFDSREQQTIRVEVEDLGGNRTTVESQLLITNVASFRVEARNTELTAAECLGDTEYEEASFDAPFIPNVPGTHMVQLTVDGEKNTAIIEVEDTTPPVIRISRSEWFFNSPREASFFAATEDVTKTTVRFASEPDWTKETQDVTVIAVDTGGNETSHPFVLKLSPDVTPPTIYGARNRNSYTNEAVAYLMEISADDACDGAVEVKVDTSAVDPTTPGAYPVTYTATDRAGNVAEKTVTFTFVDAKVSEEDAEAIAQKVLKKILTDDMTLSEQIEAIYNYVFKNVRYSNTSNKKDWRSEAVRGLKNGRGDCFTAYAAARLLLEHTDAQILSVQRSGPNTHHYWLLVNVGTGWYHFDACRAWTGKKRCFMWTDAQVRRVSKTYWRYDKSLYPPVATEPYQPVN